MSDMERYTSQYRNLTMIFTLNRDIIDPDAVIPTIKRLREAHTVIFGECSGLLVTKNFFHNTVKILAGVGYFPRQYQSSD